MSCVTQLTAPTKITAIFTLLSHENSKYVPVIRHNIGVGEVNQPLWYSPTKNLRSAGVRRAWRRVMGTVIGIGVWFIIVVAISAAIEAASEKGE